MVVRLDIVRPILKTMDWAWEEALLLVRGQGIRGGCRCGRKAGALFNRRGNPSLAEVCAYRMEVCVPCGLLLLGEESSRGSRDVAPLLGLVSSRQTGGWSGR